MPVIDRIHALGLKLPQLTMPVANYVPYKIVGQLLWTSGMIPLVDGKPYVTGRLGAEVSLEQGMECARITTLSALGWANVALDGNLERIAQVVQVRGFVASTPDFYDQPKVINGCSDLLVTIFGEKGRHSRATYGSIALPLNVPVEVDFLFAIE
jgi:enamine deaminase RidA (YjgF/YER057c/UK114 family)